MKLSGLIIETSPVHSTKSARPLSIVKFVFLCDNVYEAYKQKTFTSSIALQPNEPDDAYMSHMKVMYVPFNIA